MLPCTFNIFVFPLVRRTLHSFFFFNDPATTEIYTLSLHDALPIYPPVIWKHALKNAAIPIVTIVGIELGTLLGGSVITETIFAWPGVGRLSVQAIYNRDYPVV